MKWIEERDLLIAQTMAFVQSVAGKKSMADGLDVLRDDVMRNVAVEATPVDEIAKVKRPVEKVKRPVESLQVNEIMQVNRPSPVRISDVREEVRERVAAFRAHQELFNRERDEYCNSVLTKLHASTNHARRALDDRPPKP